MLVRWILVVLGCCMMSGGVIGCSKLPFGGSASTDDDFSDFDDFDEESAEPAHD